MNQHQQQNPHRRTHNSLVYLVGGGHDLGQMVLTEFDIKMVGLPRFSYTSGVLDGRVQKLSSIKKKTYKSIR